MTNAAATFADLPHASFHQLAEIVRRSAASPFVLQIGAMDGVLFDMMHPHLMQGGWRGVLVEPLPDMFAKLQDTYAGQDGLQLVNCAVNDHEGVLTLHRIDPAAITQGVLPQHALGITTGFPDRGFLAHEETARRYAPHTVEVTVPCRTLQSLLDDYQVENIDVVAIDTEGADWIIGRQIDWARYAPRLLCIEHSHLMPDEVKECMETMTRHNYGFAVCKEDRENMLFYKNGDAL